VTAEIVAELAFTTGNLIGEGPVWDQAGERLIWVDHAGGTVHEARAEGDSWRETRCWTPGGHIGAALPRAGGGLIVARATDFVLMDDAGCCEPFAELDLGAPVVRLNDVKCDAHGRLWAGSFAPDLTPAGGLHRIDPDGTARRMLDGAILSNGLDWSPDGRTFYFVDSYRCTLDAFDFDVDDGVIGNRRTLIAFDGRVGIPNGMAVDCDGGLWVALTCGGWVGHYSPEGRLLTRVRVPVLGVTSCGFGGIDRSVLFITTRKGRFPDFVRELGVPEERMNGDSPLAAGLFVCGPGVSGLETHEFPA
jgi:sugar lactone lactonase YvrE